MIGGLYLREAQAIVRSLAGRDIIGGDVVVVAPQCDATTNTTQVGAQMLFEILSVIVVGKRRFREVSRGCALSIPYLLEVA